MLIFSPLPSLSLRVCPAYSGRGKALTSSRNEKYSYGTACGEAENKQGSRRGGQESGPRAPLQGLLRWRHRYRDEVAAVIPNHWDIVQDNGHVVTPRQQRLQVLSAARKRGIPTPARMSTGPQACRTRSQHLYHSLGMNAETLILREDACREVLPPGVDDPSAKR
jgi:hypothetical protein